MTHALPKPVRIMAAAAFGLLVFCLPASTENAAAQPAAADAAAAPAGDVSEIERFCSNIADAARDRRYALQAKELQDLQAEIDSRMKALDEKRAEYETWMKRREAFLEQAQDGVVKIYTGMKPDAAAERLADLKPDLAAGILMKIEPRKASVILNEMDSKTAATVTTIMAAAVRREDPS